MPKAWIDFKTETIVLKKKKMSVGIIHHPLSFSNHGNQK